MGVDALAARTEAGRRNAEAHRRVGVGRGAHVLREFDAERLLRGAGRLQHGAVVGAHPGGSVPDRFLHKAQAKRFIRDAPEFVFFANAFFKGFENLSFEGEELFVAHASHVDFDRSARGNRIDGRTALDGADRVGRLGLRRDAEIRHLGAGAADGVNGRGHLPEIGVGVTARPFDREAPAVRPRRAAEHAAHVGRIDRDEAVDAARAVKERLRAADVAEAFFTDRAHKENVAFRFDAGDLKHAKDLQERAQARAVVADPGRPEDLPFAADLHVRARGEDRIHVGAERQHGPFGVAPRTAADDVADRIDHDVREAVGAHEFGHAGRALFLGEGGGFDFTEFDLFFHGAVDFFERDLERTRDFFVAADRFEQLHVTRVECGHSGHDGLPNFQCFRFWNAVDKRCAFLCRSPYANGFDE